MFELSKKTIVQICNSEYDSNKYVKLIREAIADKTSRWLNINSSSWCKMEVIGNNVNADITKFTNKAEFEKHYEVDNRLSLKMAWFYHILYIGVCQRNGEYMNIINLTIEEWNNLMSKMSEINAQLYSNTAVQKQTNKTGKSETKTCIKQQKEEKNNRAIQQYKWTIIGSDGSVHKYAKLWSFNKQSCEEDGLCYIEHENETLKLETRMQLLPQPVDILKMVKAYLIKERILQLGRLNCEACIVNHPSQVIILIVLNIKMLKTNCF
jgi:hypothetical protein